MYHLVFPAKYRRAVITNEVDKTLRDVCLEIEKRFEIIFLEIGAEADHVHMLIQTVPEYKISETVKKIKSITAREIFAKHPEVKKELWGDSFWTAGYYVNTVGKYTSEQVIREYVKSQGQKSEYEQLYFRM